MFSLLWTIPALPLAGFLALAFFGSRMSRAAVSRIGAGSVGASAAMTALMAIQFFVRPPEGHAITQRLWTLIAVDGFKADTAFRLDSLSLLMMLVITGVGFLIHVYSTAYMRDDAGYARFFAYMNLFVGAMLTLVMADNLLLLFFGWEGVGLCSFLLIGFWYEDPKNGSAAAKAFLFTRVGDAFMAAGLFLLVAQFGTLDIATILGQAPARWADNPETATLAAMLLLGGALGKSGQLPLQVWLPDAMAGPTPVSALIHAATMVTAGVYLIARMHGLFDLAPGVQQAIAIIGAMTLLVAGSCALVQRDIKRVLAYSTISQIGYMFLALGVGAWSAGMFHFMTHAIFKALLFMAAGAIIVALHHEQDMFKMGGLRTKLPLIYRTFLAGALSLCAAPLVTAGFFSKDMILAEVWASPKGGPWLWTAGVLGAFITAVYTFRMVFVTFFGEEKTHASKPMGAAMNAPLLILGIGAIVAGFIETPQTLGHVTLFSSFIEHTIPAAEFEHLATSTEILLQLASVAAVASGFLVAYMLWLRSPEMSGQFARSSVGRGLRAWLDAGWGFDWVYTNVFAAPFAASARANRGDALGVAASGIAMTVRGAAHIARMSQNGQLRWYMACIGIGAAIAIALVVYA